MKPKTQKLNLSRETVRQLNDDRLSAAAGGALPSLYQTCIPNTRAELSLNATCVNCGTSLIC